MTAAPTAAARRAAVAAAFGAAAGTYDAAADLQRLVAGRLARRLAALPLGNAPTILEIGCGTGLLSHALLTRWPEARLLITDLSAPMVAHCRRRLGEDPGRSFIVMDGERPCLSPNRGRFDLVCASLALQWFDDPGGALAAWAGLLRPGGHLAFATLAAGSLAEWRTAHAALGLTAGVADYPDADRLSGLWPSGGSGRIEIEPTPCACPDGHAFVAGLRHIGAHLPTPDRRPLPAGTLRRVLRRFERADGVIVTYQVAYGAFRRDWDRP
jgi:malonyl-CoA O-methyltransferase